MARKLQLKTVRLGGGDGPANGRDTSTNFSYPAMLLQLLSQAPQGGLSFDDVVRAVDAQGPIKRAMAEGADEVTLTEEQWQTVRDKLNSFQFALADPVLVDFGLMIRDAPEIGTEAR